ncbi:DSD1 family PLP-dependent enzyme [Pelomonas sp. SE-A7]|uniref:DSD1 family PLP-dependent enzyme n=1 Tax=Pelomonas sp. SE-A7 TaxID=3054953 RepID=UPI00259CAE3A|nr:DSD1 family PLP-dependent enzyme [Pelomonas sp. SE-A7]MDM4768060.1 DSD1 family PLP-dependent enzyme [Pelomonas sp. SE-A7]
MTAATPPFPALPPAARVGDPVSAVDTPALLLELDAFERNLDRMQAAADAAGVVLRPHAKAHKCPDISLLQVQRGAVGICCQKISEAYPFVAAGIQDVLISNEPVGPAKAALAAELARHCRLSICVDHASQIADLAAACAAAGSRIELLVEINIGQNRCGVADAPAVLALIERIQAHPEQLRFKGLQAYLGSIQHLRSHEERRAAAAGASERTGAVAKALQAAGVHCEVITGGGSGTVEFDLANGVYTEVQPGSYIGMDMDYGRNEFAGSLRFEHALFLASTLMSQGNGERLVLDAGLKSLAVDSGLPLVWGPDGERLDLVYTSANDEHGILQAQGPDTRRPQLGEQVWLVPGHCDPTFNLHDELVAVRQGRVEALWPIAARGLSR